MSSVDLAQIDRDITDITEPTGRAIDQARRTVQDELASLLEVRDDLNQRLAQLNLRIETLEQLDDQLEQLAAVAGNGTQPSGQSSSAPSDDGPSVSDLAAEALADVDRAIKTDEIAERIQQRTGVEVDLRGLAGALNAGVRSGRFAKTPAGRFKLAS